ncbi:MAG: HesB/IscA family protein [Thermodesulfobacteriota bacterium]
MINLTKTAAEELKRVIKENNLPETSALRVEVREDGCSSHGTPLSYYIKVEEKPASAQDNVFESEGVKILVDQSSLQYIQGLSLDFVESIQGRGFAFTNPNAKRSCGCGHSFSVDEEKEN